MQTHLTRRLYRTTSKILLSKNHSWKSEWFVAGHDVWELGVSCWGPFSALLLDFTWTADFLNGHIPGFGQSWNTKEERQALSSSRGRYDRFGSYTCTLGVLGWRASSLGPIFQINEFQWTKCSSQKIYGCWTDEKNKTHIYAAKRRDTSDLKTLTKWKWRDGKGYSMQMTKKRKQDW